MDGVDEAAQLELYSVADPTTNLAQTTVEQRDGLQHCSILIWASGMINTEYCDTRVAR